MPMLTIPKTILALSLAMVLASFKTMPATPPHLRPRLMLPLESSAKLD